MARGISGVNSFLLAAGNKKNNNRSGRLVEQGGKQNRGFARIATSKVFVLFVISLVCFFCQNTLIVENGKALNVSQLHNGFARNLGESSLRGSMNDDSADASAGGKMEKNYFQRKDENYDKVVQELNEKFKNEYQHSDSEQDD
ncbi:hypothetical protein, conserved [Plasmodium vivax]|uniref:Transmembrane protein n=6 Tax=Plasmodium vivax TaxID=5855 RepID=A5KBG8_PLAVS|nr:hypothetical protein PVX_003530 [Plasmodium vivax]KMZ82109.1 hypothetical protein PVIIG_04997 [Plasmodium vivax India VII]KMZ88304.1 hypothetical protein PVBG_05168 [Plasmodium vivax Brazil I]KMZ94870.1 hypothetical protein PVMG_02759 [Plasmodium vivax Mauritania I]KNA01334.1 hypothetical protein PVNG_04535 [Plasmodium vivax North Korean]EDL43218.1 hypothetical protein PVX_003530 [Plasmodium vivax]|eukprot:XP_001612945.1 hypothetical protein [Plasmodium vivax Sal-1]